jgi:apolipoprotein N-acyltransferase
VYLVSLAVAALNGAAYEWAVRSGRVRAVLRWPPLQERPVPLRELWLTAGALALPVLFVAYGTVRLDHPAFPKGPRLALMQGNVPQNLKNLRGDQAEPGVVAPVDEEYLAIARQSARPAHGQPAPDLIVWPETCFSEYWLAAKPDVPDEPGVPDFRSRISQWQKLLGETVAAQVRTSTLVGLNAQEWDGSQWRRYNSAVLFDPSGGYHGRYDKIHLVPFGEYVPLREQLPWLQRLTPYSHDYSCTPGESWTRFTLPTPDRGAFTFGALICYEDTDPAFARRYNPGSGTGPGVDFLINTSNDGWFDGTEEHEQHLAICRFRAIEARRSVARAVNMGVSAVIDPDGRVVALPTADPDWAKAVKTRGIVRAEIPIDRRDSVYARFGDWLPGLCWVFVAVGWAGARFGPVRRTAPTV